MIYKRSNKTLDSNIEYVSSNNSGIYINTSVTGANFAPYHAIYIKQSPKNDTIFLSKMIEHIVIDHDTYNIMDLNTSEKEYGGKEYLESFTNIPVPTYVYNIDNCIIEKKYKLVPYDNVLCIEYKITNNTGKNVKFTTSPCITKRGLLSPKRQSEMRYTSQLTSNSSKITLSISESINLYMKSEKLKYTKKENYLCGVNYDYTDEEGNLKTYVEDLFIPGSFEGNVKPGNTITYSIFVSTDDINIKSYRAWDVEVNIVSRDKIRYSEINEAYHELLSLARSAYNLHYIDGENNKLVLLEKIPAKYSDDNYVKNMIISIEGNYLILKRFKEAHKILESMMSKIKDTTYSLNSFDRCEALLLFIEALNRYLALSEASKEEIRDFYNYIKESIYEILDRKSKYIFADTDFLITVEGRKYIKLNALWYNALRIFVDLADKFNEESEFIYSISESVKENIQKEFWVEDKCVLKYEASLDAFPTIDMIYALSLSYPVIYDTKISMKLIDTAFKSLYTAYGMRLGAIGTRLYDGYVYPHLLVHFLKANLRQMGVTRASQKLAYNLIKDVFADIGKNTVDTVCYKYEEKTKKPFGRGISAATNAEVIRAFDMLT